MEDVGPLIAGHERLIHIFGQWPPFHDAEVVRVELTRDDERGETSPSLVATISLSDGNSRTYIVSIKFSGLSDLTLNGFNEQNVLFDLVVVPTEGKNGTFHVDFRSSYGVSASFDCGQITVLSVE